MAARVLRTLCDTPSASGTATGLRVTASIGYARFPLPPHRHRSPVGAAINSRRHGALQPRRTRPQPRVGIVSDDRVIAEALREIEADFDPRPGMPGA